MVFLLITTAVSGQEARLTLTGPAANQLVEGREYDVTWTGSGIETVTVVADGSLISLPGSPRGDFNETVVERTTAVPGKAVWRVPFLDTLRFRIRITGYDSHGQPVAEDVRVYRFRPAILRNRTANGIYIDLRGTEKQRLYRLQDNVVTNAYLTSGSRSHYFLPKTRDSAKIHDHYGVFRVIQKYPMYWSNTYSVWMTHAMRFWKGHFIHGTYPDQYYLLGRPASSGCIRLHRKDAKELYKLTPVGTRVEIFGTP